jgi:hypothetical protein
MQQGDWLPGGRFDGVGFCCSMVVGMRVASSGMQEGARDLGEEECDI